MFARLSHKLGDIVQKTTHTKTPNGNGNRRLFKINAQDFPGGIKEKSMSNSTILTK
jgi:hypothetical protein